MTVCVVFMIKGANARFSMDSDSNAVFLPPVDSLNPRPVQLPMAIPRDLADRWVRCS